MVMDYLMGGKWLTASILSTVVMLTQTPMVTD
jgi:hypothetical protein